MRETEDTSMDPYVALVTLAALAFYFTATLAVGGARRASGIQAPAMTGDPRLERAVRVQTNTLEWLPIFLVTLWLFALSAPTPWGRWGAVVGGLVWIVGRSMYMTGYMADPSKRGPGFGVQALACAALFLGALGCLAWRIIAGA